MHLEINLQSNRNLIILKRIVLTKLNERYIEQTNNIIFIISLSSFCIDYSLFCCCCLYCF